MGKGRIDHPPPRQRFEDVADDPPQDGASFFFDLKLILAPGMTAHDVQSAREAVEQRLQRTVRKEDRIVWTADGFFLVIATTHPARAATAAERVHQHICALLAQNSVVPAEAIAESRDPRERAPRINAQHVSPGSRVSLASLDRPG